MRPRRQSAIQNTHRFRRCEKSFPPQRGGIFVESGSRGSAPQRGAISLPPYPICFKATPLGCGCRNTRFYNMPPRWGGEDEFFTPSEVVGIGKIVPGWRITHRLKSKDIRLALWVFSQFRLDNLSGAEIGFCTLTRDYPIETTHENRNNRKGFVLGTRLSRRVGISILESQTDRRRREPISCRVRLAC
jgi:hypothetical protein